jgi:hypothetical protein
MGVVQSQGNALQQVNFGAAVQAGQKARFNALRNQVAGLDADEAERIAKAREEYHKIVGTLDKAPERIEKLESVGLYDEADKLRTSTAAMMKGQMDLMTLERQGVDATNYKSWRETKIKAGVPPELFPTEYSDSWFRKEIKDRQQKYQVLTRKTGTPEGGVQSQDTEYLDGVQTWQGTPYNDPDDMVNNGKPVKADDAWQMKPSDSNSLRSAVVGSMGGTWDPISGLPKGLDKGAELNVAGIMELASRIYKEGGGSVPIDTAAAQAVRQAGYDVPVYGGRPGDKNGVYDPLGLLRKN